MRSKEKLPAEIELPTGAETEVLSVLWEVPKDHALKLSEIHQAVVARREKQELGPPALTTVSSTLRGALGKKLLREMRVTSEGVQPAPRVSAPSLVASRSPQTAYQANVSPSEVMVPLFRLFANAYPEKDRREALVDMARALELPEEVVDKIKKVLPKS